MRPIGARTHEEQIEYHLHDGRAPEFDKGQPGRVELARFLIDKIIGYETARRNEADDHLTIWELGCGAGDISGPYAAYHEVVGVDVTPAAAEACQRRWPGMTFLLSPVEQLEPQDCDILVMTEFLEHVTNPIAIVKDWMPRAKWAVVGHPLDEPNPAYEPGHVWSYDREDWRRWFEIGGHVWLEEFRFPMGPWDAMILGHSTRK